MTRTTKTKGTSAISQNPSTENALEAMTDFVAFEKLCCDLLAVYGAFQGIVPQGVGRIDGGKDATLVRRDSEDVTVVRQRVVFHFSLRRDYEQKLGEDLRKTKQNGIPADLVVFLTSRKISTGDRDELIRQKKEEFGWSIEICEQQWFRVPLDGEFQRLRKQYLRIDYDPKVFRDLELMLSLPELHPNREDLKRRAFYHDDGLHHQVHANLDRRRRCLVLGKPGHGKTALAMSVGWELLSLDVRQTVFYVRAAGSDGECDGWLQHINAYDHDRATFILDDCHLAPEQVRSLLDAWPEVRKARLLLISRPFDVARAGPYEENFQERLEAVRVEVDANEPATVGRIVERILQREHFAVRDPGPLDEVVARCRGDLHIIEFLLRAWQKQPAGVELGAVPQDAILDDVYGRYLGGAREPYRQQIAAIAALFQFEIPVVSRWLGDDNVVAKLRADSYVECIPPEKFEGVPTEFLRYFHSTPARYVVQAAHHQGILGTLVSDDFVLDRLADYIHFGPANLFEVFARLHSQDRGDLQSRLFANPAVIEAISRFIGSAPLAPSETWLEGLARLIYSIWRWEKNDGAVTRQVLDAFERRFPVQTRRTLWESFSVDGAVFFAFGIRVANPRLADEVWQSLDFLQLGLRSHNASIFTVWKLLGAANKLGVSTENVRAFCDGLNYKRLGERSRDMGVPSIWHFLEQAMKAGVSKESLNAFSEGINFKDLGERSNKAGIATVKNFLEKARKAGITKENLNTFLDGIDFKALGERSHDAGIVGVMNFLLEARKAGANAGNLNLFCGSLDWRRMGRDLGPTVNEKTPFWNFHAINSIPNVTAQMAQEFIDGMGWDAVKSILGAPNAPDVLAALRAVLTLKCGYDQAALKKRGVVFNSENWLQSFIGRGCGDVHSAQRAIQGKYLSFALNGLKGYPPMPLRVRLKGRPLTLRNWTILIHNLKLADLSFFRTELEPVLQGISPIDWAQLLRSSDLRNLSWMANHFAPEVGDFTWRPRLDPTLGDPDFDTILHPAPLVDIAHSLFTPRHIGKPEWCTAIAEALNRDSKSLLAKITGADPGALEYFLWNLLTARRDLRCPAFLGSPGIGAAITTVARNGSNDQDYLAAMCGTLYLWGWDGLAELLPLLDAGSTLAHCLKAASMKRPKLIRLAAALAAVAPGRLSASERNDIQNGLDSLVLTYEIPNQVLAMEQIRNWIETVPDL